MLSSPTQISFKNTGADSPATSNYKADYLGSVRSIMEECDTRLSEHVNFPSSELERTQAELETKIKATDHLMDKIDTSINFDDRPKLLDAFNILELNARIDDATIGND